METLLTVTHLTDCHFPAHLVQIAFICYALLKVDTSTVENYIWFMSTTNRWNDKTLKTAKMLVKKIYLHFFIYMMHSSG